MAKDPRRFVSFTLSEEHAVWIEKEFGGEAANKPDAIKQIIDRAMSPQKSLALTSENSASPCAGCKAESLTKDIKMVASTVELMVQKYMADHPQREHSRHLAASTSLRWKEFLDLRMAYAAEVYGDE
jgi:hypothetical protein